MEKFTRLQQTAIPLDIENVDTDQIIPARFLKATDRKGFGENLFRDWRYNGDQNPIDSFILNNKNYSGPILVAGNNFGCGSSREHAAWALRDFGFKAVIASSFGDIFYNNCFKNQVLPIQLSKENINILFKLSDQSPQNISINLVSKELTVGSDTSIPFNVDDNLLNRIIHNLDDVDITMKDKGSIEAFELSYSQKRPWLFK